MSTILTPDQVTIASDTLAWLQADEGRTNGQFPHWQQSTWLRTPEVGGVYRYYEPADAVLDLIHDCGTVCCVAGYTVLSAMQAKIEISVPLVDWTIVGAVLLGLDYGNAEWMFDSYRTRESLINALDDAITTGQWPDSLGSLFGDIADWDEDEDEDD